MTSMCTFDHIPLILHQHRATNENPHSFANDVQTHICTRCDAPVFQKTKINAKGKCYTFSNSHRFNGKTSYETPMKECRPITKSN
jgi:hypothetical protein